MAIVGESPIPLPAAYEYPESMRRFFLPLLFASALHAETPKVTVVQTTAAACAMDLMGFGSMPCRQAVAVIINSPEIGGKFLVGIRYLTKEGVETIESRYPVSGTSVLFYLDDVRVLSATVGSLKSNEVGVWYGVDPRGTN